MAARTSSSRLTTSSARLLPVPLPPPTLPTSPRPAITAGPPTTSPPPPPPPLGNYGGPTQTTPPLPGAPAIGAGSVAANTFSTDQRGYPRTQNGLIDLGAVELQSPAANPPVLENITVPAGGEGIDRK